MKKHTLFIALSFFGVAAFAQRVVKEKVFELDKQSAKGYLSVVRIDDDRQEISLVYNTKEKAKKTEFQNYIFDYDFNKTWDESGEEPKFKSKGKRGKTRGEAFEYDEIGLYVQGLANGGTLTGKKVHVSAKWSSFFGRYLYSRNTLANEKIRSSDDRKLFLKASTTQENGKALALVTQKHKLKDYQDKGGEQLLIVVNQDFSVEKEVAFDLPYESGIVSSYTTEDGAFFYAIYAPVKIMGGPKCKDGSEYSIVKIDIEKVEVVSITKFNTKLGDWNVLHAQESEKGITFVGPGIIKNASKIEGFAVDVNVVKFDAFQIVHLDNKGVANVVLTTNDDINAKAIKYPTDNKAIKYNGKKYDFIGVQQIGNGDIVVAMQDWKMTTGNNSVKVFQEIICLHFGIGGELKGYYAIPNEAKKDGIINQYMSNVISLESSKPNILNLLIIQPHHTESFVEYDYDTKTTTYTPMFYPRFIKIDVAKKEYVVAKDIGNQEYFLYDRESIQLLNNDSEFLFIGESKNDRKLYMARFSLED